MKALGGQGARSKSDTVDWPVRTTRTFVQHYNSTHCYNIKFFFNIPLPLDKHRISDVAKWSYGGSQNVSLHCVCVCMHATMQTKKTTLFHTYTEIFFITH